MISPGHNGFCMLAVLLFVEFNLVCLTIQTPTREGIIPSPAEWSLQTSTSKNGLIVTEHSQNQEQVDDNGCRENCLDSTFTQSLLPKCPKLQQMYLMNYLPNGSGNESAGISRILPSISSSNECVSLCCQTHICSFAIIHKNSSCQLFYCTNGIENCRPQPISSQDKSDDGTVVSLVLVRPPIDNHHPNVSCETGADRCDEHEECVRKRPKSRNGYCRCKTEPPEEVYMYNSNWICERIPSVEALERQSRQSDEITVIPAFSAPPLSTPRSVQNLEVSVASKDVQLPLNEAQLYAYVVPQSAPSHPYAYEWKLIAHPDNDPAITEGQTTETLHLTRLIPGTYVFEVRVKSTDGSGAANVTIHVFPAKRTNKAPIAIISPSTQTLQLPTNSAILDGTSSTDDDKILSYKWELQKGPIGYAFSSSAQQNSPTLQINDLFPGNYTFKLTVEDADHATNFTTANVTVNKEIDYPPTANAGKDIVIYLPQTEVTLNGNASTDDKKIVQWEWKATGDVKKAVDMQDTHTAYLKLSGLEEGLYQFELTVTDEAGQVSSPSKVHLFVKKPTGNPPKADAGKGQVISLPQTWAKLDASGSKADSKIIKWQWSQLSGPNNVTLNGSTEIQVNVTGLIRGEYTFQIEVEDDAKLAANATVNVTVMQKTNESPKANAGDDLRITLPMSIIELDGTGSKDDVEIKEWKWERQDESLAAGLILGNSDHTSKLKITNLVPGKYIFKLKVKDEQGLIDEDSVSLLVVEDPLKSNLIQVLLNVKMSHLLESDKLKILQQMTLLVHDTRLILHHTGSQFDSEFAIIYLYGIGSRNETRDALELSAELRSKFGLLDFPVVSIDTVLCLNPCSGHGKCQDFPDHRECVCDAFWMENYIKRHFGSGEQNCDWSKIYVGVITCALFIMKMGLVWSLYYLFHRHRRPLSTNRNRRNIHSKSENGFLNGSIRNGSRRHHVNLPGTNSNASSQNKNKQYTLLDDEDEVELQIRGGEPEESDSDSEESLIYERGGGNDSKGLTVGLLKNPISAKPVGPSTSVVPSNTSAGVPRNGILKKPKAGIKA